MLLQRPILLASGFKTVIVGGCPIYQGLDDYYDKIEELEGGTVINVVEVKFDMLGNPMGRILDPTPGWVQLHLGRDEPYCDFLALPLDAMD